MSAEVDRAGARTDIRAAATAIGQLPRPGQSEASAAQEAISIFRRGETWPGNIASFDALCEPLLDRLGKAGTARWFLRRCMQTMRCMQPMVCETLLDEPSRPTDFGR